VQLENVTIDVTAVWRVPVCEIERSANLVSPIALLNDRKGEKKSRLAWGVGRTIQIYNQIGT
jgi:hypothetical protein